jgi:RsiW-degrading membrane proteinase PrsW (M82 family)
VQVSQGWYPDPYAQARFRWWNGTVWTHHTDNTEADKPRLPAWLSMPVLISGVLTVLLIIVLSISSPVSILLGIVPIFIVGPALLWLDRVEPEPWSDRTHAFLWGMTVAAVLSIIVNSVVGALSSETLGAVVSAPIIEEATKALGIYWAIRRRALDGVMDGVIYAGWVALGFAVIEDFLYFATADESGILMGTFVVRALLTPFAHPLFTAWTGLAMGLAVSRKKKLFPYSLWGLALAITTHAAWNGSLTAAESSGQGWVVGVAAGLFALLFVAAVATLVLVRKKQAKRFFQLLPFLASEYQISQPELTMFTDWGNTLRARKQLPKDQRKKFDQLHRALARLALFHHHPGDSDPVTRKRLEAQLYEART